MNGWSATLKEGHWYGCFFLILLLNLTVGAALVFVAWHFIVKWW